MNFSVDWTTPEQPADEHERVPLALTLGIPVTSVMRTSTSLPAQTGIRCVVSPSAAGSTMLPVTHMLTFALLLGLWPLPIVQIWVGSH